MADLFAQQVAAEQLPQEQRFEPAHPVRLDERVEPLDPVPLRPRDVLAPLETSALARLEEFRGLQLHPETWGELSERERLELLNALRDDLCERLGFQLPAWFDWKYATDPLYRDDFARTVHQVAFVVGQQWQRAVLSGTADRGSVSEREVETWRRDFPDWTQQRDQYSPRGAAAAYNFAFADQVTRELLGDPLAYQLGEQEWASDERLRRGRIRTLLDQRGPELRQAWANASPDERLQLLQGFEKELARVEGRPTALLKKERLRRGVEGSATHDGTIRMGEHLLKRRRPTLALTTLLHEARHCFQDEAIQGGLPRIPASVLARWRRSGPMAKGYLWYRFTYWLDASERDAYAHERVVVRAAPEPLAEVASKPTGPLTSLEQARLRTILQRVQVSIAVENPESMADRNEPIRYVLAPEDVPSTAEARLALMRLPRLPSYGVMVRQPGGNYLELTPDGGVLQRQADRPVGAVLQPLPPPYCQEESLVVQSFDHVYYGEVLLAGELARHYGYHYDDRPVVPLQTPSLFVFPDGVVAGKTLGPWHLRRADTGMHLILDHSPTPADLAALRSGTALG